MSQPKPRTWRIEQREVYDQEGNLIGFDLDRNEVVEAYLECETIQRRLGGAVIIVPIREQQGTEFRNTALVFKWESYVPAQRAQQETPAVEEPEPVTVEG